MAGQRAKVILLRRGLLCPAFSRKEAAGGDGDRFIAQRLSPWIATLCRSGQETGLLAAEMPLP